MYAITFVDIGILTASNLFTITPTVIYKVWFFV